MDTGQRVAYVTWWRWALDLPSRRAELRVTPCDLEPDLFWSDDLAEQGLASTLCRTSCAVQHACAAHALHAGEPFGVWGGLTEADRGLLTLTRGEQGDQQIIDATEVRALMLASGVPLARIRNALAGQVGRTTVQNVWSGRTTRITGKTARLIGEALEAEGVTRESLTA